MRILVCDDRNPDEIEDMIVTGAPPGVVIVKPSRAELETLIKEFFRRQAGTGGVRKFLEAKPADRTAALLESGFDGFDLIVLDNNLAELSFEGLPITAEAIAGFVRAFSTTPYVISLNKNPAVDFDLKYLIGDFESKADLALNTEHLECPTLWGSANAADADFAPWYWPNLIAAPARRREQIEFVLGHLDDPILASLAFPKSAIEGLSRRAVAFLSSAAAQPGHPTGGAAKPLSKITFWNHFQNSGRSLPTDHRAAVAFPDTKSEEARRRRLSSSSKAPDGALARQIVARVVAAELDYWFRRDVLAAQDVLVDAPHLKMKVGLRPDAEDGGDSSIAAEQAPFGLPPAICDALLANSTFPGLLWAGRPTFWWSEIEAGKGLKDVRDANPIDQVWVFCEDTRKFIQRTDGQPVAVSFVPEGGKPWAPLFVQRIQGKGYMPASQFAA